MIKVNVTSSSIINTTSYSVGIFSLVPREVESKVYILTSKSDLEQFGDYSIDPAVYYNLSVLEGILSNNINVYFVPIKSGENGSSDYYALSSKIFSLKSDVRGVVPYLESVYSGGYLKVRLVLYYSLTKDSVGFVFDDTRIYKDLSYSLADTATDEDLEHSLSLEGIYLKNYLGTSLLQYFREVGLTNSRSSYNFNVSSYIYTVGITEYISALELLYSVSDRFDFCSEGLIFECDDYGNRLIPMDPINHKSLLHEMQTVFTEESGILLMMNIPNIPYVQVQSWLESSDQFSSSSYLSPVYHSELYYGYMVRPQYDSLDNSVLHRVRVPAALEVLYNTALSAVVNDEIYIAGGLDPSNLVNASVLNNVSEYYIKNMNSWNINVLTSLERNLPYIYGDLSLAETESLKEAHISRLVVQLNKQISNYIETKKFILNTKFNRDLVKSHIISNVLKPLLDSNKIRSYSVDIYTENRIVFLTIHLFFLKHIEEIELNFTLTSSNRGE